MRVIYHPEAEAEVLDLPKDERRAMHNARVKLEVLGTRLPFPHQSAVKGAGGLRELRPRAGRSRWRALYRQIGEAMVVAAIGPDAAIDATGFAVARATRRLAEVELLLDVEGEGRR